jgi:hypothetical protein
MNTLDAARRFADSLHPYSTALLKCFIDASGRKRITQVGSGTYIRVGNTYGILTAQHCVAALTGDYVLGLNAGREGVEHNFLIPKDSLAITNIALPTNDEFGPDLAFITIAEWEKVSQIAASKAFFDLKSHQDAMLNDPPAAERSIWYMCGVLNESLIEGRSEAGFKKMFQFEDYCAAGGADRIYQHDGYDYIEMHFEATSLDPFPRSFAGMSGGGLWQVPAAPGPTGDLEQEGFYLSGVIFFQGVTEDGKRFLRAHGRHSVYHHCLMALL